MTPTSPFLQTAPTDWVASNDLAFAIRDRFPVTRGHSLVIARRTIATWFESTADERAAIFSLIDEIKIALDRELAPDGYNVGFNAGEAAGQTVMHLHVHVIPRYRGDMDDPRGGVRGVIPEKQKYPIHSPTPTPTPTPTTSTDKPFASLPAFVHGDDFFFEHTLREAMLAADRVDILSAFLQQSGIDLLFADIQDALVRGVRVRLLTGDYLGISSADALRTLLRLANDHPGFSPFFYETEGGTAFHPKSYIFYRGDRSVAYVGSSNLSRSALQKAVEWNLRLISSDDEPTFAAIAARFESLLANSKTKPLTRAIVDAYEVRAPIPQAPAPEPREPAPKPNEIQAEALVALKESRRAGHTKGLVVLATGVGKTLLAAFDAKALCSERVLFVAHREEILGQAKSNWQRVFPDKVVGTYQGGTHERDADVLFASVQTLSRVSHLAQFATDHFDYVVVDEFHHAAAATYRKLLGHFRPRFLLALTATPERMDGRSLLDLCGDNLVYRRDLLHGIGRRLLVPFRYFGVKDAVDFLPIPWRSGKFDAAALTTAVATEDRAESALFEYEKRASTGTRRTLCFCCTVEHADFMADFFRRRGKTAAAVHSGSTSASRANCLRELAGGTLEIVCAVDIFNEGLDVPEVNTVLMLRPTESPIVFLQQLGRGLRRAEGKTELIVIDYIGNHRSFLTKPQSLLFLLGQDLPALVALEKIRTGTLDLPEGCSIEIELEAIDLLQAMVRDRPSDMLVYEYLGFRDANGHRPSAAELFAAGVGFAPIKQGHESWFHFVDAQGDLKAEERRVSARHSAWFRDLLCMRQKKAFRMLAIRALIDGDTLFEGMNVEENARRAYESVRDDLLLSREMRDEEERKVLSPAFVKDWRETALSPWCRGEATSQRWFIFTGERFALSFKVLGEDQEAFEKMTEEMVELRLKEHRDWLVRNSSIDASQAPIILSVSHANHRPILRFDRLRRPDIPSGNVSVTVDGEPYVFSFQKIAVNVATRETSSENVLPSLLRRLLGPSTGQPGIRHYVDLVRDDATWRLGRSNAAPASAEAEVLQFPKVAFYADVKVACGAVEPATQHDPESIEQIAIRTMVAIDPKRHFVVQASGDSMDGGATPIADGSLVLCEWARDVSAESVEGRPFLLVGHNDAESTFAVMKVPRRTENRWMLESWNPAVAPQELPAATSLEPVARVLGVVERASGLLLWGRYNREVIANAFGQKPNRVWQVGHHEVVVDGKPHTILMVTLRKDAQTKVEHRYADRFLSRSDFQWESQASTQVRFAKGQHIIGHVREGRQLHLFVKYDSDQDFIYLGTVLYRSHEGEKPMRVMFTLDQPLPETLWKIWS